MPASLKKEKKDIPEDVDSLEKEGGEEVGAKGEAPSFLFSFEDEEEEDDDP